MELGALVYGNSDGPTKKAGMAAFRFLSDTILDALSRITLIHRVALVPVLLYFSALFPLSVSY